MKIYRDGVTFEVETKPEIKIRDGHVCEVFKTEDGNVWFVTLDGTHFCAHGDSFHDAVIAAREKQNPGEGKARAIEYIREHKLVNLTNFCLATGACRAGAIAWAKQERLPLTSELNIDDVFARLDKSESNSWGKRLREALNDPRT